MPARLHDIPPPTDILSPLIFANSITNNWFGGLILIGIFAFTFIALKAYKTEGALVPAAALTFIASVLMVPLDLIKGELIIVTLVVFGVSLAISYYRSHQP